MMEKMQAGPAGFIEKKQDKAWAQLFKDQASKSTENGRKDLKP